MKKMSQKNMYRGLCETCRYDGTCTFHRSKELAIIQCREFDPVVSQVIGWPVDNDRDIPMDPAEVFRLGLCSNCTNIASCGFPNARNKVLMCEEYTYEEFTAVPMRLSRCSPKAVGL